MLSLDVVKFFSEIENVSIEAQSQVLVFVLALFILLNTNKRVESYS